MWAGTRLREMVVVKRVKHNQWEAHLVDTCQQVDSGVVVEEGPDWTMSGRSLWTSDYRVERFDVVDASVVFAVVDGHSSGAVRDDIACIPWESVKLSQRAVTRRQFGLR